MQDFRDIQYEHDKAFAIDDRPLVADEVTHRCCDCRKRIRQDDDKGWCSKCSETMCWRCVSEHDCGEGE